MRRSAAGLNVILMLGVFLALFVIASLLPDSPYQSFQLLDGTIHRKSRWIYERTHFDPTPIDVLFIGPSRTAAGVVPLEIETELATHNIHANVVNFSLPETGRNINCYIIEETLKAKSPKLIVIGVTEKPSRFGHSAYKFIAPNTFILNPHYFPNWNYFSDISYLPFRQIKLNLARFDPRIFGLTEKFDPIFYKQETYQADRNLPPLVGFLAEQTGPAPIWEILRGVRKLENQNHPPILPKKYADVEFGDERVFVRRIVELAKERNIKVAFLYIPYYSGPNEIQDEQFYAQFGSIWNASYLSKHAEWYADYGHLDKDGARNLSRWLTPFILDQNVLNP